MKHLALALGILLGAAASAGAAEPLTDISRLLVGKPMICADFIQSKSLRALTRPLISRGRLIFIADKGVLWRVRDPFPTQVMIKKYELIKWDDSGKAEHVGFGQSPVFAMLARVFLAVLTGELNQLRDSFRIDAHVSPPNWQLTLTPKDTAFAAIIAQVSASGGRFVDTLRITEGRGDNTTIKFSGMTAQSCPLDGAEKGYFAQ